MRVITTRDIVRQTKTYFDIAERERVSVKRGNKYVNLIVTDTPDAKFIDIEWINEFLAIPAEYRCNPFDTSPSGDLYFADKRNVEKLNKSIEQAKKGQIRKLSKSDQKELLGL